MVKFKRLTETAQIPILATSGAAGFDLYADCESDGVVLEGETIEVSTGISAAIPHGWVGLVQPRSGWAFKNGTDTMAGVIDSDYRGEIKVLLTCHIKNSYQEIKKGYRIAQMIVVPRMGESMEVDELDGTVRGANGFGSTGA